MFPQHCIMWRLVTSYYLMYGQCSLSFKIRPRSMVSLRTSEMRATGHGVEA
ncbi:hypothetical protein QJS10_CPB11g01668 [Acorus calamus]|uniref:Uncharacterized protein n=1 Tax=Acorus calamus TaxID=4465 RepID=A0AAV9DSM6_ACOCL|nr:hypothetical protein QJS10_CPB11g01668 [Acorus calamus]